MATRTYRGAVFFLTRIHSYRFFEDVEGVLCTMIHRVDSSLVLRVGTVMARGLGDGIGIGIRWHVSEMLRGRSSRLPAHAHCTVVMRTLKRLVLALDKAERCAFHSCGSGRQIVRERALLLLDLRRRPAIVDLVLAARLGR